MKTIQVLGPFGSGTNLLCNILKNSCDNVYIKTGDEITLIWKHVLNRKLIDSALKTSDTIFIIMYKNVYNWVNSINNYSYDIEYTTYDQIVTFQDIKYKNIIELYNTYYEMYIQYLIENDNIIWIDYYKLIQDESFEYLQHKLNSVGISLRSKKDFTEWLNTPSKEHGICVKNNAEALTNYPIINKKIREDMTGMLINRDILTFFNDEFDQPHGNVFVLVCDKKYLPKAKRTIEDLRSVGAWRGDLILITVGFILNKNYRDFYNIINYPVKHINTNYLLACYNSCPLKPTNDNRTFDKLGQWDKLHVFDDTFRRWDRVVYLDSGLRVLDNVNDLLQIECTAFMAPEDTGFEYEPKQFKYQLDLTANKDVTEKLWSQFSIVILNAKYFINCMWMYNTEILNVITKQILIDCMNDFPISMTNEMAIMNLIIHFKFRLWKATPKLLNAKYLFDWSELNHNNKSWRDFYMLKYPVTINFNCE